MNTLIEISALLFGLTVFVLLAVISWAFGSAPPRSGSRSRFVPGNYDGHAHHGDGHDGFIHH